VAVVVMWSLCALLGGWIVSAPGGSPQAGILSLRLSGIWNDVLPDTYVLVFFAVLIGSAGWLWRLRGDGDTAEPVAESADVLDPVPAGQH
jgi:alpha-1,2-mannosyltransferase